MSETTGSSDKVTPIRREVPFERCIANLLDAYDKYGLNANRSREEKLKRLFLVDPSKLKGNSTLCEGESPAIKRQAIIFYQAVAMSLEIKSGSTVCSIVEWDDEGFGRAVVYSGRLVLAAQAWRQGQFGFTNMEDACREGEKLIASGLEWLEQYPAIARLV